MSKYLQARQKWAGQRSEKKQEIEGKKIGKRGRKEMEITTKGTSVDVPVGHKSFGKKNQSPLSPHSLLQFLFLHPQLNCTGLHFNAVDKPLPAKAITHREKERVRRLKERSGGRDRGAGNHTFRLCLCGGRK